MRPGPVERGPGPLWVAYPVGVDFVTERYLLPCSNCGRQTVIECRQAGETIRCECGASLQAPTLLDMRHLELAPTEPAATSAATGWGIMQQVWLVGFVLALIGIGLGVWLHLARPVSRFSAIDPERVREECQKYTPSQTWHAWEILQQGLDRRIDQSYAAAVARFQLKQIFVGVVLLGGATLMVIGWLGRKRPPASRQPADATA